MLQRDAPRLVLASGSASRRALLQAAGLRFETRAPGVDEAAVKTAARIEGTGAEQAALLLAELKAAQVARNEPGALVIGADQILVCRGIWFDKPADIQDARAQLEALRGETHRLATAAVCMLDGRRVWHYVATPHLTMRAFTDTFLAAYLDAEGDGVLGSVGCYRLEGLGAHLFEHVDGEHAAILGLPLLPLLGFLRQYAVLVG
jgi:septum formation protein